MRELVQIKLREVQLSKSRPTQPEIVNALAESMGENGLINPIIVKKAKVYDGIMVDGFKVVAGNHRVSAARALGWDLIDAFVVGDDLKAELVEIDENLCRAELSPAQRASVIQRRKEIWEALHPEQAVKVDAKKSDGTICPTRIGYKQPPKNVEKFAAETAKVSGESKRDINRHVSRAEALGSDLNEVVGTSLDKGVELDALKAMAPADRKDLIQRAKAGEQVSARSAPQPRLEPALCRTLGDCIKALMHLQAAVRDDEVTDALLVSARVSMEAVSRSLPVLAKAA